MNTFFGEWLTVIEFLNTIRYPSVVWILLFAFILFKLDKIGKK